MNPRVLLFLCALVAVQVSGGQARAGQPLPANPDSVLTATVAGFPGESLTLEEALTGARGQATSARIAQAQINAAESAVRREKGAFDPELFGRATMSGADTPSASLFAGADVLQTESTELAAGARLKTTFGTEFSATLNSLRLSSNSSFAALAPEYQSYGELTMRHPLLKGFGPAARSDLTFAESSRDGAVARYEAALLALATEVETVYWQLYAAERNLGVTLMVRSQAQAFLDDTRVRASAGMIGPSQVANAEFFLTEAEQGVLDTEEDLDRLSDRLASLLGRRPAGKRFRPGDHPPGDFVVVDPDSLVAVARRLNPELQAIMRDTEALKARERGAVWDARPSLDLIGGLGGNGLAGNPQDVFFPGNPDPTRTTISGSRGDAASQALGRDYPTWNVGLVFSVPLGNREGSGERDRLRAEVVRSEQVLLSAQRAFEEEIRAQHRELERGRQRLEIAARGVSASYKQVEIGMIEFQNGQATAFELVRLAADLGNAQQRYSQALVRTARAAAVLRQLTGGWYNGNGTKENGS
jgi:outer membrane protein TolC